MHLSPRAYAFSGWLPASLLGLAGTVVLVAYGTPLSQVAIYAAYVAFGIAVPGMLWVRLLRGGARHIAEDLTIGLVAGYAIEIATYLPARAVGAPSLVLVWPAVTLVAFAVLPALRRYWRGDGARAPAWWSWSLAAMLAYLLAYSAGTFFTQHHLTGTDTPYVDMPFHLALIGELRHHLPPATPYVTGLPLAYHWFFYAEAAAASWATGIDPVTLLYRLSGLPIFIAFVTLTAVAARRLTGRWWPGPVAVAVALFGTVAGPYGWSTSPVFDTETLGVSWTSPTNLFGLALFAAVIVVLLDVLGTDRPVRRRHWLLLGLLILAMAGAKASLAPLLIGGLVVVVVGGAIAGRRLGPERPGGSRPVRDRPDPGRDPALPRDDRRPGHRPGFAPRPSGRRASRCPGGPWAIGGHPAHRRVAGGPGAVVVPVGRRVRAVRPRQGQRSTIRGSCSCSGSAPAPSAP